LIIQKDKERLKKNYWIPLLLAMGYVKDDFIPLLPKWRKSVEEILVTFS